MNVPTLYLIASLLGAAWTVAGLGRFRHTGPFTPVQFFMSWLASELPLFHIAWQALATVVFAAFGAFDGAAGVVGLAITFVSWAGLGVAQLRAFSAGPVLAEALVQAHGEGAGDAIRDHGPGAPSLRELARPFSFRRPGVERISDIAYGDAGKRNLLDVYKPTGVAEGAPVLLQIHGGAWIIGEKQQQAQPLMNHLCERGWVCVSINYRLAPRFRFPDFLIDCKRALAWTRANIAHYGGDPSFLALTGGSAGGHLSSLVALTANDPRWQPGFEQADTSVSACIPFYGIYDFLERKGHRGSSSMTSMLERMVMPASAEDDRELWEAASPISQVHADAPPFFVIHGRDDTLAFVEDARDLVERLRSVSRRPVGYAELPGAEHAFDIFHSWRSAQAIRAATSFLERERERV
jgi:acetyl esterase/lipase